MERKGEGGEKNERRKWRKRNKGREKKDERERKASTVEGEKEDYKKKGRF